MSMGVYSSFYFLHLFLSEGVGLQGDTIHIGVGFCVARSDSNGQCESPEVWDGQG